MVSVLDSKVSGSGLTPGWGHCVVFLDNFTLAAPLSLLVASCCRNQDKLLPDGPLGL